MKPLADAILTTGNWQLTAIPPTTAGDGFRAHDGPRSKQGFD
jgi:hypothetical protein